MKWADEPKTMSRSVGQRELRVGPATAWFQLGEHRVNIEQRRNLKRFIRKLIEHAVAHPGEGLNYAQLHNAGWPDEPTPHETGTLRVRVALSTLRRLGLREILVRRGDCYLIDPDVSITLCPDT